MRRGDFVVSVQGRPTVGQPAADTLSLISKLYERYAGPTKLVMAAVPSRPPALIGMCYVVQEPLGQMPEVVRVIGRKRGIQVSGRKHYWFSVLPLLPPPPLPPSLPLPPPQLLPNTHALLHPQPPFHLRTRIDPG